MPQLFYQLPTSAGGTGVIDVTAGDTVGGLTRLLARELGVLGNDCRLVCYRSDGGAALPDSVELAQLLLPQCSLQVAFTLNGGKTHGRISAAGKVRKQTPPVQKADKPREKTGRARKRQLYNRRFPGGADTVACVPAS